MGVSAVRVSWTIFVLCVVVAAAALVAGGSSSASSSSSSSTGAASNNHDGWYKIELERDFKKGAQPFNGKGHKSPHALPIDARTGMVYTGSNNRSREWYTLMQQVSVNVSGIRVWTDRPVPIAVERLIHDGTVDDSIDNETTITTNGTCNHGGHNCKVLPQTNMAPQRPVNLASHHRVLLPQGGVHVREMSAVSGSCGVTASFSSTADATTFALLFNNFNVVTSTSNGQAVLQQSANCAFRVPITVPMGLTVAALKSQLRGYASSSPQGQAGIAWTAGIGTSLDPNAWADVYNNDSYSARYWAGGVESGADFDPITVSMELDSQNPTFSPCGSPCANCATSYEVPIDFQFTLSAVRAESESQPPHAAESRIFLDSQDTVKSIAINQPLDFEMC